MLNAAVSPGAVADAVGAADTLLATSCVFATGATGSRDARNWNGFVPLARGAAGRGVAPPGASERMVGAFGLKKRGPPKRVGIGAAAGGRCGDDAAMLANETAGALRAINGVCASAAAGARLPLPKVTAGDAPAAPLTYSACCSGW